MVRIPLLQKRIDGAEALSLYRPRRVSQADERQRGDAG